MDAAVILDVFFWLTGISGAFLLPLDGWLYGLTPEVVIGLVGGVFFIVSDICVVTAALRSEKKYLREVVGYTCLILSILILFAGLLAESELWMRGFLVLGIVFLIVGAALVVVKKPRSFVESARTYG